MEITQEYQNWKAELVKLTAEKTGCHAHEVNINDQGAKEWFNSGATPYQCFRETYQIENDAS